MRVALADNDYISREGLTELLHRADHQVVCSAADGDELVQQLSAHSADVAILDIQMPPGPHGGLTTAKKLRNEYPGLGLLFLTNYGTTNYIMSALDINNEAIGYRLKERVNSVGNLTDTLTRINNGEIVIEPVLVKRLVDRTRGDKEDPVAKLKPLESDVLKLMAEGHANQGIADKLHRGLGTVEKSITAIFSQLGLPDTGTHHRRVLAVLAYLRAQRPDN